jgi:hypothetical protein
LKEVPDGQGDGCVIDRHGLGEWINGEEEVSEGIDVHQHKDSRRDYDIDGEKKVDKPSEEQKYGNMLKKRNDLNNVRHEVPPHGVVKVDEQPCLRSSRIVYLRT